MYSKGKIASRTGWAYALPTIQLILMIILSLYIPFQFEQKMVSLLNPQRVQHGYPPLIPFRAQLGLTGEVVGYNYPPPAGRALYAVNFPAYVISGALSQLLWSKGLRTPQWTYTWRGAEYSIGTENILFAIIALMLWYWIGKTIDDFIKMPHLTYRRRNVRTAEAILAFALGAV